MRRESTTKRSDIQAGFVNIITNQYAILIFLLCILMVGIFNGRMGNDEGMWGYIGRIWSQNGIPPYVGAVENKTPGIFELFAISHVLFGVNFYFVRVVGVIAILFSSLTVYLICKKLHTHLAGIIGMIIFGLTMSWHLLDGPLTAQTETFMVLFSTLSFYFILTATDSQKWKNWVVLSGFSMGLAIAFKQIAVTTTLALLFFFIINFSPNLTKKRQLLGLILLCSGIVISTSFSLIPLLVSGVSIREYIDGAWLILINHASHASSIEAHITKFFRVWLNSRIVVFYPFLYLCVLQPDLVKSRHFIGLLIWMLLDFLGANAAGHYYGHQIKQLMPSLSIIIGISLGNFLIKHNNEKPIMSKYTTITLVFLVVLLFPFKSLFKNMYIAATEYSDERKKIGLWLRNNTNDDDYIYISGRLGNPILSYSGRVSSSKYFNSIFVTGNREKEKLLSDLKATPPAYFLLPAGIGIEEIISTNYEFSRTKQNYRVFKRIQE